MTTAVQERPVNPGPSDGGRPARRAVVRWAWRMFRREWHRQALVLALLVIALAATTVGLAVVSNAAQLGADSTFGTANTIITLPGTDPELTADITAIQRQFGVIDVVSHQTIAVPGSVSTIDLRAESPGGVYVGATLRLDAGRYPNGPNQVAVTTEVAKIFDLHLGGVWHESGRTLRVVGLVENPLNLQDQFALVPPGQVPTPASVSVLVDASKQGLQASHLPSGTGLGVAGDLRPIHLGEVGLDARGAH